MCFSCIRIIKLTLTQFAVEANNLSFLIFDLFQIFRPYSKSKADEKSSQSSTNILTPAGAKSLMTKIGASVLKENLLSTKYALLLNILSVNHIIPCKPL